MRAASLLIGLVGCIQSSSVICPDGESVCPEGHRCIELGAQELCVLPEQVDTCVGIDEGEPCTFGDPAIDGTCYASACLPAGCGNARLDAGEACDDGNTASLDGCSDACTSNETCRNGVLDLATETCDDANPRDHDGCSSSCAVERPRWEIESQSPSRRLSHGMAYHAARRRIVLFGGRDLTRSLDDTWEWDGTRWRDRPGFAPLPRANFSFAYDHARQEVVLFGGDAGSRTNDTWVWAGRWIPRSPMLAPSPRAGHAMAYDARRQRVVLFGGVIDEGTGFTRSNETWEWDGVTWQLAVPGGSDPGIPSRRSDHAMAYDPARGKIVLFGGVSGVGGGGDPIDTWEYDGSTVPRWTRVTPGTGVPSRRHGAAMAFDPTTSKIVLVGGTSTGPDALVEVWEWDGATWSSAAPPGLVDPAAYNRPALVADPERGIVFVGGGQTWTRRDRVWAQDDPDPAPPARVRHAGALADARRTLVVFGGARFDPVGDLGDTWLWRGEWKKSTAIGPDPRADVAMAYDTLRDEAILFGDFNGVAETWRWRFTSDDDGMWSQISNLTTQPDAQQGHVMVYDAKRHEIVLFGGGLGPGVSDDMWIWDGSQWTEKLVSKPPPRGDACAAYDPIRGTVVMFGGRIGGSTQIADLWEWDGTGWTDRTPMLSPGPRRGAGLAWDAARGRLVLVGGSLDPTAPQGIGLTDDVWELERFPDGSARWSIVETQNLLSARSDFVMAPAIDGAGVTVLQGDLGDVADPEVYTLRWDGSPAVETCTQADSDADGALACADPDCWTICTPTCEPGATCDVAGPTCGDGVPSRLEDCATCPEDHGPCAVVCGDFVCAPGEACVGDCPP